MQIQYVNRNVITVIKADFLFPSRRKQKPFMLVR